MGEAGERPEAGAGGGAFVFRRVGVSVSLSAKLVEGAKERREGMWWRKS